MARPLGIYISAILMILPCTVLSPVYGQDVKEATPNEAAPAAENPTLKEEVPKIGEVSEESVAPGGDIVKVEVSDPGSDDGMVKNAAKCEAPSEAEPAPKTEADKTKLSKDIYQDMLATGNTLKWRMPYGSSKFIKPKLFQKIKGQVITKVTLVYTVCKRQIKFKFNQSALNQKRYNELRKRAPSLFKNHLIYWDYLEMRDCIGRKDGSKIFHGFLIEYRPKPSKLAYQKELTKLKVALTPSEIQPKKKYEGECANHYVRLKKIDTIVKSILDRNPNWTGSLVVVDVTLSMYKYTAQMLLYIKLKMALKKMKSVLYFNDGDGKANYLKKIGKAGGLHFYKGGDYSKYEALAYKAMSMGRGGDYPENDMEAVIEGIKKCGDCKDIILIADNYSKVRDLKLLVNLKRPVRIVLTGSIKGIDPQYLKLAKETKGSVHTADEDIVQLKKITEGKSIKIKGIHYRLQKGSFVPEYKFKL